MTTFTHHLSRVLREMGIQKKTYLYHVWTKKGLKLIHPRSDKQLKQWLLNGNDYCPAYCLDDLLTLIPEIGEKMFWDKYTPQIRGQRFYKKQMKVGWVGHSHLLLDAFLEGSYPKAEEYIMSIIEKK